MNPHRHDSRRPFLLLAALAALALPVAAVARGPAGGRPAPGSGGEIRPKVDAKPLSEAAHKGLQWLAASQLSDGSWGQGEESANMGSGLSHLVQKGNVGDTCFAGMALMRAGSTPAGGAHAAHLARAAEFVVRQVERSDDKDLSVTDTQGTRLQAKLGPDIDTFAAVMFLTELKGKMPGQEGNARVDRALHKVLSKLQTHQRHDGTWSDGGWAPALAQAVATRGINKAKIKGAKVDDGLRRKAGEYARGQVSVSGEGAGGGGVGFGRAGSAGVELYSAASALSALGGTAEADSTDRTVLKSLIAAAPAAERPKLEAELQPMAAVAEQREVARDAVVARMADPAFVSGFGSNGGEEFLSYMLIGEELVADGGERFAKWDREMTANLVRIQNRDGSWTGHHCITGRTFCTAAALLVLTVDRATSEVAAGVRRS